MTLVKGFGFLFLAGWPGARLLFPRGTDVLFTPAVAALVCTAAALASLLTRTPLGPWLVGAAVLSWVALAVPHLRIRRPRASPGVPLLACAAIAVMTLPPLAATRLAPVKWDARSIWWLHAKWLWAGGQRAAEALGSSVYELSHPDYPPLASAAVAGGWTVAGGHDLWLAQAIMALLTYAGVLAAAVAICELLYVSGTATHGAAHRRALGGAGVVIGSGFALTAFAFAGDRAVRGYADLLWGSWFAAAAVLLLLHPVGGRTVRTGAVALAVAMLTKNEGMVAGFALIALACLRHRRHLPHMLPLVAPAVAAIAWVVLSRALGAESDLAPSRGLATLFAGDGAVLARLAPTLEALRTHVGWVAVVGSVVSAAGLVFLRRDRSLARIGSTLWVLSLTAVLLALVALAYLISPRPIGWHLATSVHRTTIAPRVLMAAEIAAWAAVAARTLFGGPPRREPPPVGALETAMEGRRRRPAMVAEPPVTSRSGRFGRGS